MSGSVTFHILRHTFASWYMMNGGNLYPLLKYLGHLTERYAHLSHENLLEGMQFIGAPKAIGAQAVDTSGGPV